METWTISANHSGADNRLPKWAREYLHHFNTFVGAKEVQEILFLRDQNRALIKLVSEIEG